jgi:hypothetical protein
MDRADVFEVNFAAVLQGDVEKLLSAQPFGAFHDQADGLSPNGNAEKGRSLLTINKIHS